MPYIYNPLHAGVFFAFFSSAVDKPAIWKEFSQIVPLFHGYPVTLVCKASGYPEPTITWIFDDKTFTGENLMVKEKDGKYTCIARNDLGTDTREVNVVIRGKKYS